MIIQNAIQTPDGTILVSRNRHDFQTHLDKNGSRYGVDGGLDYFKITTDVASSHKGLYLQDSTPIEGIANTLVWGTRPNPKEDKVVYRFLSDLETDHLKAIAKTQKPTIWILMSIFYILEERGVLWQKQ